MSITIGLVRHDMVEFPNGLFRFDRELEGDQLLFEKADSSCPFTITEAALEKLWAEGRARRRISRIHEGTGRRAPLPASALLPAGITSEEANIARTKQFCVVAFDNYPTQVSKGRVGGNRFLGEILPQAKAKGFTHDLSFEALMRALQKGFPGHRPIGFFVDLRGKGPRKPKHPERAELMCRTVDYYWEKRTRNITDAFAFFCVELRIINERRKSRGEGPIPEPRRAESVRKAIRTAECHERWRTKYSKREADQQFLGTAEAMKAEALGELIIIDHTTIDTFLLLDPDTGLPLGRVTLTIAIDVCSRAIVGYFISPEPPSIYSVSSIIKIINRSKKPYDEKYPEYGYEYSKYYIRGDTYLLDNGVDFASPATLQSFLDIGVEVIYAPIATPEFKPYCERIFDTFNKMLFHKLPGGVLGSVNDRRKSGQDPSKEACITLAECDELMYRAIAVYHRDFHSTLRATPESAWKAGLVRGEHKLVDDVNALDHLIGNEANVVIHRDGITFKNCQFHDREATSYILNAVFRNTPVRERAKKGEGGASAKVKIKWDPGDCSRVSVHVPGDVNDYVTLPNIFKKYPIGSSFWHHQQVFEFARNHGRTTDSDFEMLKRRHELNQLMEAQTAIARGRLNKRLVRALAASPRPDHDLVVQDSTLDEAESIGAQPFADIRTDADRRATGVRPGAKKAEKTRKANDIARARVTELLSSPDQLVRGDQASLSVDWTKKAGW